MTTRQGRRNRSGRALAAGTMLTLAAAAAGAVDGLPAGAAAATATGTGVTAATGSVAGTVHVKKAYLNCTGAKSDGDVVLSLEPAAKTALPAPAAHAAMDQKNLVFVPHVLAVQKGTTVDYLNEDNVEHNVSSPSTCCAFDLGQAGKGVSKSHTFDQAGAAVLLCKLHPDMAAYVVVVGSPWFTTVHLLTNAAERKQSAEFSIAGVPPGAYVLRTWNKKLVAEDQPVTVAAGATAHADVSIHRR